MKIEVLKNSIDSINEFDGVFIAIGDNKSRWKKSIEFNNLSAPLISLVHPSAVISNNAKIYAGSVIMAKVVIQVDTMIKEMCIINTGSNIDHDCFIGKCAHISPGVITGGVDIGDFSWVGIGSSINENIKLGKNSFVASGATVVRNVKDNSSVKAPRQRV